MIRTRLASLLGAVVLSIAGAAPAAFAAPVAPAPGPEALRLERVAAMKRVQQNLLMEGARERLERARRLHGARSKSARGVARKRPLDLLEGGGAQGAAAKARAIWQASRQGAGLSGVPNVMVNNRAGDLANAGQSESSIAALGNNVLVAWNDGQGFAGPGGDTQGFGYSTDGGATFTDGGVPPQPAAYPGWTWTSDPVVTVNEKTGDFYYCAMANPDGSHNGVAVARARFSGGNLSWDPPVVARQFSSAQELLDKPWLFADSTSNRLYLSYSTFGAADTILFQRSDPGGATWSSAPQVLSANADAGFVQGSRPIAGPAGEVYVVWYTIGQSSSNPVDYFRIRKSTNQGIGFGPEATVASLYSNFGSGAPGFNREQGITFPSIAVDRSTGPHRGRVYVAWNESVNFYDDNLGTSTTLAEVDTGTAGNNSPGAAQPFAASQEIRGAISNANDFDYYKLPLAAGQTLIAFADSVAPALNMSLRLFGTDGTTRLAFSAPGPGLQNLFVYTVPVAGTYYLRCASVSGTGGYHITTGLDAPSPGERARDHRDVFVASSDNGTSWNAPVRASDSPAGFDDWLPEVAVTGDTPGGQGSGHVYCLWYDWRDSPPATCGGESNTYLAQSDDGGATWLALGAVSNVQTAWSNVASNIAPNQGDYVGLYAAPGKLFTAWADGRNGDPDVFSAVVPVQASSNEVVLVSATATPTSVTLTWLAPGRVGVSFTVERMEPGGSWSTLGVVPADANGHVSWVDTTVTAGARYGYRLTWDEGGPRSTATTWVDVPTLYGLALSGVRPNPTAQGVHVFFSLPVAAPATLELLDLTGRRVNQKQVGATPGAQEVDLGEGVTLRPGFYIVRLTQNGHTLNARVTVVK